MMCSHNKGFVETTIFTFFCAAIVDSAGASIGAITGGVVGALSGVIVLAIIIVMVIIFALSRARKSEGGNLEGNTCYYVATHIHIHASVFTPVCCWSMILVPPIAH